MFTRFLRILACLPLLCAGSLFADSLTLAVNSTGADYLYGSSTYGTTSTVYLGYYDDSGSSNHAYRCYCWWNTGIPSTAAIENATISSITLTRSWYQSSTWFNPRAARIGATRATWNGWNATSCYNGCNIDGASPRYWSLPSDPGSPNTVSNIAIARADFAGLRTGDFGLGFNCDSTYDFWAYDCSSQCIVSAGGIQAVYWNTPALSTPASGTSIITGTPTYFSWGTAMSSYANLLFRLQISQDPAFGSTLISATVAATNYTYTPINSGAYYWRIRIEDPLQSANVSSWSGTGTFTVPVPPPVPAVPANIAAANGLSTASVRVTWDSDAYATAYSVYRASSNSPGSSTLLASTASTYFDDATASPNLVYWYFVRAANYSGTSVFSTGVSGYRANGGQVTPAVKHAGATWYDGGSYGSDGSPHFGYIDNTWPTSDQHYIAWFWWDGSEIPAGSAVDTAIFASLGFSTIYYPAVAWSHPRAGRIPASLAQWNAAGDSSHWGMIDSVYAETPLLLDCPQSLLPNPSYNVSNIPLARSDIPLLLNGGGYGLAFDGTDTSGTPNDDTSNLLAQVGTLNASYYGTPALLSPASGSAFTSGVTVTFEFTGVAVYNQSLRHRVQIARDSGFTNLVTNALTDALQFSWTAIDGGSYYWRVRIEDKDYSGNASGWSPVNTFTVTQPGSAPPAPVNVQGSNWLYIDKVLIAWSAQPVASSYQVFRSGTNNPATAVLTGSAQGLSFADTTAVPGATYYYWVKAVNSAGSSPFSDATIGIAADDRATTVSLSPVEQGSIEQDTVYGLSLLTSTRFGLDDGTVWNSYYRAFIWYDLSAIPTGVAIDSAAFDSIGYDFDSFPSSSEKQMKAARIGVARASFDGDTLQNRFNDLDVSSISTDAALFYNNTTTGASYRIYNLALQRSWIAQLRNDTAFGLAFGSDESDAANREDTNLYQARGGTLTVRYYATPSLSAPADGATFDGQTPVSFAWDSLLVFSNGTYLRYHLQVATDSGFANCVYDNLIQTAAPGISFQDNQKYYWRVRIEDAAAAGNCTAWSAVRSFTIPLPAPGVPQDVVASHGTLPNEVLVTWSSELAAASYQVWRATSNSIGSATLVASGTAARFDDTSVQPNTLYYYWVRAINASGTSANGSDSGWLGLAAPGAVSASAGTGGTTIAVTWTAVPNATGYAIYRNSIDDFGSAGAPLATTGSGVLSYTDATAVDGQNYYYWVRATGTVGNGAVSAGAGGYRGLAPPLQVFAGQGVALGNIPLSWTLVLSATGYDVFRSPDSQFSDAGLVATVSGTAWNDLSATNGCAWFYWVSSRGASNESNPSAPVSGWRGIPAPASAAASVATDSSSIAVTWSAVPQAAGYRVLRAVSADPTTAAVIATVNAGTTTSYADSNVTAATDYFYWIQAFDAVASSTPVATGAGSLAPSHLLATDGLYPDRILVTWLGASHATGYTVWRSGSNTPASATQIGTTTSGSYADTAVAPGNVYWYWVRALLPTGTSAFSNGDPGNAGTMVSATLPILSQGGVMDGTTDIGAPDFGFIDNTWPVANDEYRGYVWWNCTVPSGVAIDKATISSLGYQNVNYTDTTWSSPTARRMLVSKAGFDGGGVSGRWSALTSSTDQPTYWNVPVSEGAAFSVTNVPIQPADLYLLKQGNSFGLAFTSNDTTGGAATNNTENLAVAGSIVVTYYPAPNLIAPGTNGIPSGTPVTFFWGAAFAKNTHLQYRLQVASDAGFNNLAVNTALNATSYPFAIETGSNATWFWRVRIEDIALAQATGTALADPTRDFSAWSVVSSFQFLAPTSAPGVVQGLGASNGTFQGGIQINWTGQPLAEYYDIYRSTGTNFAAAQLVQTVNQQYTQWFDSTAPSGQTFSYWIVARNSAGSAAPTSLVSGVSGSDIASQYFPQSVASGSPRPNSIVLWTRVFDAAQPGIDYPVGVDVATDNAFANIVFSRGDLQARFAADNCVKTMVTGLNPYTVYYYRFRYSKAGAQTPVYSHTGRTKTAPAPDQNVTARFVYVTCQDRVGRFYNTWQDMLWRYPDSLDFVVWDGDYIYETTGDPTFQFVGVPQRSVTFSHPEEAIDLGTYYGARSIGNYRDLYKTYRSDPVLQQVHESYAMLFMQDDHETSDDEHGATSTYFNGLQNEYDPVRKANADQVMLEYIPLETGMDNYGVAIDSSMVYPNFQIYSTWRYGANCEVILTDSREYRPDHLVPEDAFPGLIVLDETALKNALKAIKHWDDATLNAQWPSICTKFDSYDPNFDANGTFGDEVQAAVVYWYQNNEGLSYADAVAIAKTKVVSGKLSANFVNLALQYANIGVSGYTDAQIASFPHGISYAYLCKVLPYTQIGSRYGLVLDNFRCYAWDLYQRTGGASENVYGDRQQQWIRDTLANSTARWKCFTNTVMFTPIDFDIPTLRSWMDIDIPSLVSNNANVLPVLNNQIQLDADSFDGFPNLRDQMIDLLANNNAVLLTGDIHSAWITRHTSSNGKILPEFTGAAISSQAPDQFFEDAKVAYPELAGLLDVDALDAIFVPLAKYSAQFAQSHSEILDASIAMHGYEVVECTPGDMHVYRHEIPTAYIQQCLYGTQYRDQLTQIVQSTMHTVSLNSGTVSMDSGVPLASASSTLTLPPLIAEGSIVSGSLTQNAYPVAFSPTLHGSDPAGNPLSWTLTVAPAHGQVQLVATVGNSNVTAVYRPFGDFIGEDTFVVTLANSKGRTAQTQVYANVAPAAAYDLWNWHRFQAIDPSGTNSALHAPTADPNHTGFCNLLEYAMNSDPTTPLPAFQRPRAAVVGTSLTLTWQRNLLATDIATGYEQSTDLVHWTPATPVETVLSDDGRTRVIQAQLPIAGSKAYMRLKVAKP